MRRGPRMPSNGRHGARGGGSSSSSNRGRAVAILLVAFVTPRTTRCASPTSSARNESPPLRSVVNYLVVAHLVAALLPRGEVAAAPPQLLLRVLVVLPLSLLRLPSPRLLTLRLLPLRLDTPSNPLTSWSRALGAGIKGSAGWLAPWHRCAQAVSPLLRNAHPRAGTSSSPSSCSSSPAS